MKYCSECGAAVKLQIVTSERRQRYVCSACGTTHYENPRIIVCCSVCCDGKVLLCRRAQEPGLGKWAVPSGFLECGETLEEGAARETFEETGVIVDPLRLELQAVINMVEIEQVAVAFRIDLASIPVVSPGPECLEAAFLAEQDIPPDGFAWQGYLGNAMRRWFKDMRSGEHAIYLSTLGSEQRPEFKFREYKIDDE
jgi:ADP-ribose pyrophosphatase YjhB (NUDIX family)